MGHDLKDGCLKCACEIEFDTDEGKDDEMEEWRETEWEIMCLTCFELVFDDGLPGRVPDQLKLLVMRGECAECCKDTFLSFSIPLCGRH